MLSAKWRPRCLGLNVLTHCSRVRHIWVSKLTNIGSENNFPLEYENHMLMIAIMVEINRLIVALWR